MAIKRSMFYHKLPVFGLDIGSQSIKVMQLHAHARHAQVIGYGSAKTDTTLIKDGVVVKVPETAKLIDKLLSEQLKGKFTTNRVIMSIPVAYVFTRVLTLPRMPKKEFQSAIELEVEQSIPLPAKDLYYDYEVTAGEDDQTLVRLVAAPKKIVDSYVSVCELLNLDLALIQTNIEADAQLCILYEDINDGTPYIILDVGGNATDIGILDSTLRVTGTVDTGGEKFTKAISKGLEISESNAQKVKVSRGLNAGKDQDKIKLALAPHLDAIVDEIKRIEKFYNQRIRQDVDITQIVITGGGANMPGLGDYLTNATRIPTRVSSPWAKKISFGRLESPASEDLPRFLSAAGLALTNDTEINR